MAGWGAICVGLVLLYIVACLVEKAERRKRIRRDREEWLRRYNEQRERRWRGDRWCR